LVLDKDAKSATNRQEKTIGSFYAAIRYAYTTVRGNRGDRLQEKSEKKFIFAKKLFPMWDFLIGLLQTVVSAAGNYRRNFRKLDLYRKHSVKRHFYPQALLKGMLAIYDYGQLPQSDRFIDYSLAFRNGYYNNDMARIRIRREGEIREEPLPYKIIVDYSTTPAATIRIDAQQPAGRFGLPVELKNATDPILAEYCKARPGVEDNPAVSIRSLKKLSDRYVCELRMITYFDLVRTNQTLDMPLDIAGEEGETTMRIRDLGPGGKLRTFEDSILANPIGVSAVWYMHRRNESRENRLQFFLKPRRSKIGIFNRMMGTISGTAQPPAGGRFADDRLEEYAKKEMLRKFYKETGFDCYMAISGHTEAEIEIVPLAFARELMRGGIPQFFFAIKTPEISDKELTKYFCKTDDGQRKYRHGIFSNATTLHFSPETAVNLLLAFRYIQRNRRLDYIDLDD